ncbi:MAG: 50S ribosomal protein L29 [Chloroflexi bacterium]|nr:50S ribosomal protein L29 [Chloroflexota bacterium]
MADKSVAELKGKTDGELRAELDATQRELMNLRFRKATRQLENTSELRKARKRIARIKTFLRERELGI